MAVYLNRKISVGQGGLAINGVIENYVVAAGQNISAGDFVSFVNNQAVSVLEEITEGDWTNPTLSSEYTFVSENTIIPTAVKLTDTKVAVLWSQQSGTLDTFGAVLTIDSNGTITQGSTYTILTGNGTIDAAGLTETKFVFFYYDNESIMGRVVNVNGDVLTAETEYVLNNDAQRPYNPQVAKLSATKLIVAHSFLLDNTNDAFIVEVNGNVLTSGTPVQFSSDSSTSKLSYNVSRLDDNTAIIAYKTAAGMPQVRIASISGTIMTLGGANNLAASPLTGTVPISVVGVSATKTIVVYQSGAQLLTVSGFSIGFEGFVTFNATGTIFELVIEEIDNDQYYMVLFRDDADSSNGKAVVLTVNGNNLTASSEYQFNAGDPEYPSYVQINPLQGLIVYEDHGASNDYGNAVLVTGGAGVPTGTFQQIYEINGVANEAGTAGETIGVYVPDLTPEV